MDFPKPQHHTATVVSSGHLDGKVQTAIFQISDPANFSFLAGQYCSFFIDSGTRRTYSIILPPNAEGKLGVCVDISPAGLGSKWLTALVPGQQIEFLGPLGRFVVDKVSTKKKVFVATGTGISAIRSMILDLLNGQRSNEVTNHELTLYWGLRFEEDIFWKEEFETLAKTHANFRFQFMLSRPTENWQGSASWRKGRVTDFVVQEEKNLPESEFYLCGNRQMIYDMKEQLVGKNVPEEQIKTELFY